MAQKITKTIALHITDLETWESARVLADLENISLSKFVTNTLTNHIKSLSEHDKIKLLVIRKLS